MLLEVLEEDKAKITRISEALVKFEEIEESTSRMALR